MPDRHFPLRPLLCAGCILIVPACSSAGGGKALDTPPPAPPAAAPPPAPPQEKGAPTIVPASQQPRRSAADDAEYRANYFAAEAIGALYALNNGYTGQGVLVGVMDNGVAEVPELAGQLSGLSRDFGSIRGAAGERVERGSAGDARSDHGTPVAAIIAARDDGAGMQGLAPSARIVSLRVDYQLPEGTMALGEGMADALRYAADHGVRVVNRSIGRSIAGGGATDFAAAVDYYSGKGGLLVQSTGNGGAAEPSELAEVTAANRDGWLFVSALMQQGDGLVAAPYANGCGSMMDRCVVALGEIVTQGVDGALMTFTGTSAAAPQASALAALILSKWPHLSGVDVGNIILGTARDLGERGVDPVYGAGLIDVRAALWPVEPKLSNGALSTALSGSRLMIGPAFGTGDIRRSLAGLVVVDRFGRDFAVDLSGAVTHVPTARVEHGRDGAGLTKLASLTGRGWSAELGYQSAAAIKHAASLMSVSLSQQIATETLLSVTLEPNGRRHPYLGGTQNTFAISAPLHSGGVAASVHSGVGKSQSTKGFAGRWYQGSNYLEVGLVSETGAVLGFPTGNGPLRFGDGADTAFVSGGWRIGGLRWTLQAEASAGFTRLRLSDELALHRASTLVSGQFGVMVRYGIFGGNISAGLLQPLTVLHGDATLRLPVAYDKEARTAIHQDRTANLKGRLAPQLSLGYAREGRLNTFQFIATAHPHSGGVQASCIWSAVIGAAR